MSLSDHRIILLAGMSAIALAAPARAQDSVAPVTPAPRVVPVEPPATEAAADPQNAIIVTGTRRTDRTLADSPVPVDVISGESLTNSGLTEVNKVLNQ